MSREDASPIYANPSAEKTGAEIVMRSGTVSVVEAQHRHQSRPNTASKTR